MLYWTFHRGFNLGSSAFRHQNQNCQPASLLLLVNKCLTVTVKTQSDIYFRFSVVCRALEQISGGKQIRADRSGRGSWHSFIPKRVFTILFLVCPALKMTQESRLGWV